MGEIAEMMLDGTLCEGCGVFLNDEPPGYPRHCDDCAKEARALKKKGSAEAHQLYLAASKKCKCPTCGKKVKEVGLSDHMRDAHKA